MKRYMVVGGSSGIGKSAVNRLSERGHEVISTWNERGEQSFHGNVTQRQLNVLEDIPDDLIPEKLDGLIYCPGNIMLKPFHRIKTSDFVQDFELQVVGAVKTLQAVMPALRKSDSASVVLFSTVAVQNGFNFHSLVSSSKGAIEGLVRALSAEWAPSIRVNAIAPSLTQTSLAEGLLNTEEKIKANGERHPLKRIGQPDEIAAMAEFLLSEDASWITGQVMKVDGGMSTIKN